MSNSPQAAISALGGLHSALGLVSKNVQHLGVLLNEDGDSHDVAGAIRLIESQVHTIEELRHELVSMVSALGPLSGVAERLDEFKDDDMLTTEQVHYLKTGGTL